jgi:hypothetical protein
VKKLLLAGIVLAAGAALADKVVTLSTARSRTYRVEAQALPDGGCAAQACGELKDSAGNVKGSTCTPFVELSGAGQTRCLNLLSSGDALWRVQEGVQ